MEKNYEKFKKGKIRPEYEEDKKETKEKQINEIQLDRGRLKKQTSITIEGIEVFFPYFPYESQILYMQKGILKNKFIK